MFLFSWIIVDEDSENGKEIFLGLSCLAILSLDSVSRCKLHIKLNISHLKALSKKHVSEA